MKMKKSCFVLGLILGVVPGVVLAASTGPSLEEQMAGLNLPANQAPAGVSSEKLYSVQSRFSPLSHRIEMSVGSGQDFTSSSFVSSQQLSAAVRYHFNDRWSLGVSGEKIFNSLTQTANQMISQDGIIPDLAYATSRADVSVAFNTLYGKFRLTMDRVFYLDQYVSLGAGMASLDRGTSTMGTLDLGFAFWMGQSGVLRVGVKDHVYQEKRALASAMTQHWVGHVDLGWMLGGVN